MACSCPHCIRKCEWFLSWWIGRLFSWMLRRISLGFGNASPSWPRSLGEPVPKRKENYVTIPWKDCNECFNYLIFGMNRFCWYKSIVSENLTVIMIPKFLDVSCYRDPVLRYTQNRICLLVGWMLSEWFRKANEWKSFVI